MDEVQAFEWLDSLKGFCLERYGLKGIASLLDLLGRPDRNLKFIHIAGTNGKGSVARFCSEALIESGKKTGLFISPHIIQFNERIQVNGRFIENCELVELLNLVRPMVENLAAKQVFCSQFDVVTAVALEHFKRNFCDFVVLEAGMGGRLDSTNAVLAESVVCAVITRIGLDHVNELGDSLKEIAFEKAGIVKPGVVCVCSRFESNEVFEVLNETCKLNKTKLIKSYDVKDVVYGFGYNSFWFDGHYFETKLSGPFQVENATVALTALCFLNSLNGSNATVKVEHMQKAFKKAWWPARFEIFKGCPLIILDGAHNVQGLQALSAALDVYGFAFRIGVFSMLKTKNYVAALSEVKKMGFFKLILTQMDFENVVEVAELELVARSKNLSFLKRVSWPLALNLAKKLAGTSGVVVVFGSLYFAAQVRKKLRTEKEHSAGF